MMVSCNDAFHKPVINFTTVKTIGFSLLVMREVLVFYPFINSAVL